MAENISVFDCDGHIIEWIPEMVPFLDPVDRGIALKPRVTGRESSAGWTRFTTRATFKKLARLKSRAGRASMIIAEARARIGVEFLTKAGVSESVLFRSEGNFR